MKLLLDTSTFLWLSSAPLRLSVRAKEALDESANQLFLSHASSWEISWKCKKGKLLLPDLPQSWIPDRLKLHGIESLALDEGSFFLSSGLPAESNDPFDRLLAAQAINGGFIFLTPDPQFAAMGVQVLW